MPVVWLFPHFQYSISFVFDAREYFKSCTISVIFKKHSDCRHPSRLFQIYFPWESSSVPVVSVGVIFKPVHQCFPVILVFCCITKHH